MAFVVVAFTIVEAKMTHGGMVFWYDQIPWAIRDVIRSAWSTVTGQPPTRDLFRPDPATHICSITAQWPDLDFRRKRDRWRRSKLAGA